MQNVSAIRGLAVRASFTLAAIGMAIVMATVQANPADAQDGDAARPVASHDVPERALELWRTGKITDHPDRVATAAGEGAGFGCFDRPALWYRTFVSGPFAVSGEGQAIAVFVRREGQSTVDGLSDLVEVGCLPSSPTDITAAPLLSVSEKSEVYVAVSTAGGVRPFTIANTLDLTTDVICQDDGTAEVTHTVVNLTDRLRDLQLRTGPELVGVTVGPGATAEIRRDASRDGRLTTDLFEGQSLVARANSAVDCRPNAAPNSTVASAAEVQLTATSTTLNEIPPPIDKLNGTSGPRDGELGERCFDLHGPVWYSFAATTTSTGFSGNDDQLIAVFRTPLAEPQSIADLQLIDCAEPEDRLTFPTTPGERIFVAVSEDWTQRIQVTEPVWASTSTHCDRGTASIGVSAGQHDELDRSYDFELRSLGGDYIKIVSARRYAQFQALAERTYELRLLDTRSGEELIPRELISVVCRAPVPNDEVAGAVSAVGGYTSLHPNQLVTRQGEDGLGCFDAPASWYRVSFTEAQVIIGAGQDFAVFSSPSEAPTSLADLYEVACFTKLDGVSASSLAPLHGGSDSYFIAVSSPGANLPWRLRAEFAVIAEVSCTPEGQSRLAVQIINETDGDIAFSLVVNTADGRQEHTGVVAAKARRDFVSNGVADGEVHALLREAPSWFRGADFVTIDCVDDGIPERPDNDDLSSARWEFPTGSATKIHDGADATGRASLELGEIGDCYGSTTTWHQVQAIDTSMSIIARDEQRIAVHRSAADSPSSIADLEVIACGREQISSFETVPGESLFISLSAYHRGDVWVTTDRYAYVDVLPTLCGSGQRTTLVVGNDAAEVAEYRAVVYDEAGVIAWSADFSIDSGARTGAALDEVLGDGTYEVSVVDLATNRLILEPTSFTIKCGGPAIEIRAETRLQGSPKPVAYLDFVGLAAEDAIEWRIPDAPFLDVGQTEFGRTGLFVDPDFTGVRSVLVQAFANGLLLATETIEIEVVAFDPGQVTNELSLSFELYSVVGESSAGIDLSLLGWNIDNAVWGITGLPPGVAMLHNDDRFWFEGSPSEPGVYPIRICNDWLGDRPVCATMLETTWRVGVLAQEVTHHVSCLAGRGRIDTTIVNPLPPEDRAGYELEFPGLTRRFRTVDGGDWARLPITAREDGSYLVRVLRDGDEVSVQNLTVDCDDSPTVSDDEVTVIVSCRDGRGYILVQMVNPTAEPRGYVVEFADLPNRSQTAHGYAQAVRAVTGRPPGSYDVAVRVGATNIFEETIDVQCF